MKDKEISVRNKLKVKNLNLNKQIKNIFNVQTQHGEKQNQRKYFLKMKNWNYQNVHKINKSNKIMNKII